MVDIFIRPDALIQHLCEIFPLPIVSSILTHQPINIDPHVWESWPVHLSINIKDLKISIRKKIISDIHLRYPWEFLYMSLVYIFLLNIINITSVILFFLKVTFLHLWTDGENTHQFLYFNYSYMFLGGHVFVVKPAEI